MLDLNEEFYRDCYESFNKLCDDFSLNKKDFKTIKTFKNDYSSQQKFNDLSFKEELELDYNLDMFFGFNLHLCEDIDTLEDKFKYLKCMNECIETSFVIFNALQGNVNGSFQSYSNYIKYCTKMAKRNKGWRE